MELSNERFEIEIISKSEFVDDYSAKNFGKNFLVTIWNIRISGEPLRNWMTSEIPCYDEVEFQRCVDERREFKEKIEQILGQKNINISQAYVEFFTAIKIKEMDNK